MADRFQAPRGTADVLPADAPARARIERVARSLLERAGYARIETPVFEDTELFARGVEAPPAGEAVVVRTAVSPRAPAGRALSPVHPARRGGDRLRLAARRRRA